MKKIAAIILLTLAWAEARAVTNTFFNASQTMTVVSSNMTAVTINSGGYLFTYSVDGYWSPSVGGTPTGRPASVVWPNGVEALAYTAGPSAGNGANITIKRADGKLFDMQSFTGKILLNTAAAGGAFEIMPLLNGNDGLPNPLLMDCTGYAGWSFPYTTSLAGYDTYQIHMWGDFALTALTLIDTNPVAPPAPTNTIVVSASPAGAGTVGGGGDYASNSVCAVTASPNPGWGFKNWTVNNSQVSTSPNYNFTVRSNRTLVANFVPAYTVTTAASPSYAGSTTGAGTFNSNSIVTVSATPASGFQFVNWTDSGAPVGTATNYSFTATANRTLVANFAPQPQTAVFDFDTGTPALYNQQPLSNGLPQLNRGVTATFSTVSGGWSFQTPQTSAIGVNPVFAGRFLYPSTWWSALQIQFSEPLTDFALDFTTGDISSEYNTASTVRVTAWTNSPATPVGSGTAQGQWLSGAYPEGHVAFHSATPFTGVTVDIAPIGVVSGLLFADNLVVQRATVQTFNIAASAAPANAGTITGAGSYSGGASVTLSATSNPGFIFANWTESGSVVSSAADYVFTVSSNRTLVANFITNTPPLAFGGAFFQLSGQPLAINISDLMWNDYDPNGGPVVFTGVSATSSNGLTLTTNATQILVPANSVADGFSYTIRDANGGTATGAATIAIITNVTSRALSLDLVSAPGTATVNFSGVPWYFYTAQRATNVNFTGAIQAWTVQAGPDGSIFLWDDFTNLDGKPSQAFYRLFYP